MKLLNIYIIGKIKIDTIKMSNIIYIIINSVSKAARRVGIPMIKPYILNFLNEKSILYVFSRLIHIIPANAPTGVIYAAILEAIILA